MKLSIIASASLLPTWITFSEASFPPYFPSHLPPEVALPPLKTLTFQTDFRLSCHFYPNAHPFQKVQKRAYLKKKNEETLSITGVIRYILEVQNKELELGHWNYTGKNICEPVCILTNNTMAAQSALSHIWNHLQSQFSKPVKSRSSSSLWNTSPDVPHSSNTLVYFCAWVMLWFKQTVFYLHSTYLHEHKQTVEFWKTVHCCRICIQWILELVQRRILSFLLASQGIWRCVYSLKILKRENVHI